MILNECFTLTFLKILMQLGNLGVDYCVVTTFGLDHMPNVEIFLMHIIAQHRSKYLFQNYHKRCMF